jgi:hypothetical protein
MGFRLLDLTVSQLRDAPPSPTLCFSGQTLPEVEHWLNEAQRNVVWPEQ